MGQQRAVFPGTFNVDIWINGCTKLSVAKGGLWAKKNVPHICKFIDFHYLCTVMFQVDITHTLLSASLTGLDNHRGGVECNSQSSTYGDNSASAALEEGAAFFVCANSKNSIAMIKNNSIELGTYVSPAIKVAQVNPRRVMCVSPMLQNSADPNWNLDGDNEDVHNYGDL